MKMEMTNMRLQRLIKTQQVNKVIAGQYLKQSQYSLEQATAKTQQFAIPHTAEGEKLQARNKLSKEQVNEMIDAMNVATMRIRENIIRSF